MSKKGKRKARRPATPTAGARTSGQKARRHAKQRNASPTPDHDDHDAHALLNFNSSINPNGTGVGSRLEQYLTTRPRWNPADIIQGYANAARAKGTPGTGSKKLTSA